MLTVLAFVGALGLLIAVHEYGHYRMAVACGVNVLRFSVGFGRPLLRWRPRRQHPGQDTEFVLAAFPLGGYVRMLDEREAPVPVALRHRAFNRQSLPRRAAIVAAGPLANLLLAVLLYATVNWLGVQEPRAVLASPVAGSLAERAGLRGGEQVLQAGWTHEALAPVRSFEHLRWLLTQGALNGRDLDLRVAGPEATAERTLHLPLGGLSVREADAELFRRIGLLGPLTRPEIGELSPDGAASQAGLRRGDLVLQVDGTTIVDGQQLRELIRASAAAGAPPVQDWRVRRDGVELHLPVRPALAQDGAQAVGRIGAYVGAAPEFVRVRYGAWDGLAGALARTWEVSALSLRMMGKMLIGEASLRNLSGPLTIADYAGKSASLGLTQYLVFLALISVSLGVLNLLPLPVLDGGHLLYYLWEGVTGKGVPDTWANHLQRAGVALLLAMMSIALFNDVTRLFG